MYNYKEEIESVTRACEHPGCSGKGEYRAPKNRSEEPDYHWFCLDHVREFNKNWNYFSGMNTEEIEHFQKDAMLGHRPTWNYQTRSQMYPHVLREKLRQFMGEAPVTNKPAAPPIPPKHRKALQVLGLEHPVDKKTIRQQYKTLVKQYHPDVNQGDSAAEERFKLVSESYRLLIEEYAV